MRKEDIRALANMQDDEISICRILDKHDGYIQFAVDEDLPSPKYYLDEYSSEQIVSCILQEEQIDSSVNPMIACSFTDSKTHYLDKDVMFQTFITCFANHRPLVLSPDIIWLLIAQTMAKYIENNAEKLRDKFVDFERKKVLNIWSHTDIFDKKTDWPSILRDMYSEIAAHTKNDVAPNMRCDFTTTGDDEYIASIATLMGAMKTYFRYHVHHMICGIPNITLLGTEDDWKKVLEKAESLKIIRLKAWYEWLQPILKEFVRAAQGKPHRAFWKSIVLEKPDETFSEGGGCIPDFHEINGWSVALFPYVDGKRQRLDKCMKYQTMETEMTRVKFLYHRWYPDGSEEVFPMELWSGFIGVEENKETFALTPKIGWFVRQSDVENENLARLKAQDRYNGIELEVDSVPDILRKFEHINRLILTFKDKIVLPDWLKDIDIDSLIVFGKINKEAMATLKQQFAHILINPNNY